MANGFFQIRCNDELKNKIRFLSEQDNRSMSNYVISLIEKEYKRKLLEIDENVNKH